MKKFMESAITWHCTPYGFPLLNQKYWSELQSALICQSGAGVALRKFFWSAEWSATPKFAGVVIVVHHSTLHSSMQNFRIKLAKIVLVLN